MMFALAITLLAASANAQLSSSLDSATTCGNAATTAKLAANCATCDEDSTFKAVEATADGYMCGSQLYNPATLRCCGGTLRSRSVIGDASNKDININRNKNSAFCYGDKHVSSAEMVCGTKIVPTAVWDADGDITKVNGCCAGVQFVATEWKYTKDKGVIDTAKTELVTRNVCCAGKVTALAVNDKKTGTYQDCCAGAVIDIAKKDGSAIDNTVSVCCSYRDVSIAHKYNKDNQCCGTTYVATTSLEKKDCKCTGAAVDNVDSKGVSTGFCCQANKRKAGTWIKWADAFTSASSPLDAEKDTKTIKVWTAKGVCGCDNTLDTSIVGNLAEFSQQVAGEEANIFQTTVKCSAYANEDAAAAPCADAQKLTTPGGLACCAGKAFLGGLNAECRGKKGPVALAKEARDNSWTTQADLDAQVEGGSLVAGAFSNSDNFGKQFVDTYSTVWRNTQAGSVNDGYCGASSAQAVVASLAALVAAVLAL